MKIIAAAAFLYAIYLSIKTHQRRRVSKTLILAAIYTILFYTYFRWHNRCIAWEYMIPGYVTYFDIAGGVSATIIVLYLVEHIMNTFSKSTKSNRREELLSDDAITRSDEDLLDRAPFVKAFTNTILSCDTGKSAYSIGLVAPWGNGKTSFIKLFVEEAKHNKELQIIHFSPWHLSSKTDIISAFFNQLSKHIATSDSELFKMICNYSNLLMGETRATALLNTLQREPQPDELYENISNILATRNERIVFIIDDLDRLEGKEILEVFKIIRGCANFPKFIFIAAYDKDYVIKAINNVHGMKNERFIEKFFQTEFYLPIYSTDKIERYILSQAQTFMSEKDYTIFKEEYIEHTGLLTQIKPYEDCIKNIRDAKRWINSIKLEYKFLKDETRICDLADIILLKLHFPAIYNIFSNEYQSFLYTNNNHYNLWQEGIEKQDHYFELINSKKKNLWHSEETDKLNEREKEKLRNIFARLLPESYLPIANKAFNDPFFTPRYFYGILQNYDIPQKELDRYIAMPHEELKQILSKDFIEQRSIALLRFWRHFKPANDAERHKALRMIFYACSKGDNLFCSQGVIYYLVKDFDKSKDEIAQILHNTMLENGASYYASLLINEIKKNIYEWSSYMTPEEYKNIQLENLKQAIAEELPTSTILKFFWLTGENKYCRENGENHTKHINTPKALEIMKAGIIANPQKFLYEFIGTETSPLNQVKEWRPYDLIHEAWGKWDDFGSFLKTIPATKEDKEHSEYLDFFEKFKENSYKDVAYNFQYCKRK